MSSEDPVALLSTTYVAVVADVLDRIGLRDQVMDHSIRPIVRGTELLIGRAHTIRSVRDDSIPENPYEHEIAAVDAVQHGDVVVIQTGDSRDVSIWGELLATRASHKGYAGTVLDGGARDIAGLLEVGRPTFAASVSANDSRGRVRVVEYGTSIECGGVTVEPGDIVLADLDGVVVVPSAVALEVAHKAIEKIAAESSSRNAMRSGASAADAYAQFGVL